MQPKDLMHEVVATRSEAGGSVRIERERVTPRPCDHCGAAGADWSYSRVITRPYLGPELFSHVRVTDGVYCTILCSERAETYRESQRPTDPAPSGETTIDESSDA